MQHALNMRLAIIIEAVQRVGSIKRLGEHGDEVVHDPGGRGEVLRCCHRHGPPPHPKKTVQREQRLLQAIAGRRPPPEGRSKQAHGGGHKSPGQRGERSGHEPVTRVRIDRKLAHHSTQGRAQVLRLTQNLVWRRGPEGKKDLRNQGGGGIARPQDAPQKQENRIGAEHVH